MYAPPASLPLAGTLVFPSNVEFSIQVKLFAEYVVVNNPPPKALLVLSSTRTRHRFRKRGSSSVPPSIPMAPPLPPLPGLPFVPVAALLEKVESYRFTLLETSEYKAPPFEPLLLSNVEPITLNSAPPATYAPPPPSSCAACTAVLPVKCEWKMRIVTTCHASSTLGFHKPAPLLSVTVDPALRELPSETVALSRLNV